MASTPWIVKEPDIQALIRALEQSKKGCNQQRVPDTPPHSSGDCQLETNGQMSCTRDSTAQSKVNGRATPDNLTPVIINLVDPPEQSEPTQDSYDTNSTKSLNDITIDPHLRSTLDAYYCAFRKIGDARAIVPQFDELCDIHRDIWQQLSKPKNSELVDRIRDFRVKYESDMTVVRKTETCAKALMYDYLKEECQQQWSPYTNGLIDKINVDGQRLDDDLSDQNRRGMQSFDEIKKRADKDLMDGDKAQRIIKAKFENAETVISRHWIEKKYRRVVEERDKQMEDARGLCAYVTIRNSKDVARRIDGLKKDVLDGLRDEILQSYITKRAQGYAPTLQHIATHTQTHCAEALQSIVSEWHQRLTPVQLITDVYSDMEATKVRLDAVANQSDKDTVDRVQAEVAVVEKQVTQALRKAKRLRQDQIMLSNARKKARLCSIERKVEQFENMIDQAKQTVLSESFPVQTDQAVTEVYEVLNNHGEFIRRLVDPVAAKSGEEINKAHLDTISTLHDGLTFPLRFSIEKLAQGAVQDVLGKAMERLDILEKRIV